MHVLRITRKTHFERAAISGLLLCALALVGSLAPVRVLAADGAVDVDSNSWFKLSATLSGQTYEATLIPDDGVLGADNLQGWVDTANAELAEQLRDDLRFSREALLPLAVYLNYLFPELDRGAPTTLLSAPLNPTQLDRLLNVYFDLLGELLPLDSDRRSYLEGAGFSYSNYIARRLSEQARVSGECLAVISEAEGDVLSVREDRAGCIGDAGEQTVWVNRILIAAPQTLKVDNIDAQWVEQLLEQGRQQYMGDPAQGIGGFPLEDLLGLVQALGDVYAASGYGNTVSEQMTAPVMQQLERMRRTRGINFDQLKSISLELQNYLRRQEYFLASTYLPQQDFNKATGEVVMAVSFGTLGDVTLRNGATLHYSEDVLLDPFREFKDKNVSRALYSAYFAVNDLPGVQIRSGLFEPGDNPGETRLVLDVQEDRYRFSLATDNYGSEFTGAQRAIAVLDWYSPLGRGDALSLGVLQSIDPADSTFGFFNYSLPLFDIAHQLAFSSESHEYDSIDGSTGTQVLVHGEVQSLYLGYDYKWRRSKALNVQFGWRGFQKHSEISVQLPTGGNTQISEQETDVTGTLISTDGDVLIRDLRMVVGWQASLAYGEQKDAGNSRVAPEYMRFSFNTKGQMVLPWGPGANISHLSARFAGAYSDDLLPSFEQAPLGGPFGVRAFKSSDFTADTMALLSLEWRVDVGQHLFGDLADQNSLRFGVFAETAYGEANSGGSAANSWAHLSGYGLLLSYQWRDKFTVESSFSVPGQQSTSNDFRAEISDDDYTVMFDARYLFY